MRAPLAPGGPADVVGVLLSVDYESSEGRTWLRLWVKADSGGVVALLDQDFAPYFWVLPEEGASARAVADALAATRVGDMVPVATRVERRVWQREERDAVRVVLKHPGHTPPMREAAARVEGVDKVLEADIPFASRFVIDRGLVPLGGIRAWTRPAPDGGGRVVERVESFSVEGEAPIRVLAFDIEVHNPRVAPEPSRDAVVMISVVTPSGDVRVLEAEGRRPEEGAPPIDAELVERFAALVREEDPDVIVTYNGDGFDWPFLVDRAAILGVTLDVGRHRGGAGARVAPPHVKQAGPQKVVEIAGRLNVDLLKVAARDLPEVKVKTLENVSDALGVLAKDEREHVPGERVHEFWDDPELRPVLARYAADDARATFGLARALLPQQVELARMIRQPLDDVARMGRGRQVDFFLLGEAHGRRMLAPNRGQGADLAVYEGGFVMEPVGGLHENVVALDFSAMYPSLMIGYNISPDTFVGTFSVEELEAREHADDAGGGGISARDAEGRPVWVAPEVGHAFLKEPEGFVTDILRRLLAGRREAKAAMRNASGAERELLNVRQQSLKVLVNAAYGYMGWAQARWYSREGAEATSAWGRHVIRSVMARAERRGIRVLYGDTDSIFVKAHPDVGEFVQEVNRDFPLELDVQERFDVLFFTGAKKRYAGLTESGDVVARGLEVRRGDWCELAKRTQREVLDTVLRNRDPDAAARRVRDVVEALRAGHVPAEDLTITKTLTMSPAHYKVQTAHAAAVMRAMEERPDFHVPAGAKVRYVVVKPRAPEPGRGGGLRASSAPAGAAARGGAPEARPGAVREGARPRASDAQKVAERSKLVEFLEPADEIDVEYYVDKQVVPATVRILEHFGHSEDELKGAPKQKSIFEF